MNRAKDHGITDDQILVLAEMISKSPESFTPPSDVSHTNYLLSIATDCHLALAPDSVILSEDANRAIRESARARLVSVCAEQLRLSGIKL